MRAFLYILTSLAVIGLAFWAYRENYATQQALSETEKLRDGIRSAHSRLAVLRAEWAYQNRPDRLRDLAVINFDRLGLLPLPEVTAIGYATPMFTVILAALMLGETVRFFRISAVALGLVGVMIVIWPRLSVDADTLGTAGTIGALMVLGASILRALVQIHIRTLVKTEHTAAIFFYFSRTATVLSLLSRPCGWVVPSAFDATLLIGAGLVGGVAQILVTSSYRFGGASMLAPFDYASLIFAAIIGYFIFAEVPTLNMVAGAALVVLGGVLIIWRERQLGMDRRKARQVTDPKG